MVEIYIKVKDTVCDYPKCNNTVLSSGTITAFGDCGHDCCPEHVIRTYHGKSKIVREHCGVCELNNKKEKVNERK